MKGRDVLKEFLQKRYEARQEERRRRAEADRLARERRQREEAERRRREAEEAERRAREEAERRRQEAKEAERRAREEAERRRKEAEEAARKERERQEFLAKQKKLEEEGDNLIRQAKPYLRSDDIDRLKTGFGLYMRAMQIRWEDEDGNLRWYTYSEDFISACSKLVDHFYNAGDYQKALLYAETALNEEEFRGWNPTDRSPYSAAEDRARKGEKPTLNDQILIVNRMLDIYRSEGIYHSEKKAHSTAILGEKLRSRKCTVFLAEDDIRNGSFSSAWRRLQRSGIDDDQLKTYQKAIVKGRAKALDDTMSSIHPGWLPDQGDRSLDKYLGTDPLDYVLCEAPHSFGRPVSRKEIGRSWFAYMHTSAGVINLGALWEEYVEHSACREEDECVYDPTSDLGEGDFFGCILVLLADRAGDEDRARINALLERAYTGFFWKEENREKLGISDYDQTIRFRTGKQMARGIAMVGGKALLVVVGVLAALLAIALVIKVTGSGLHFITHLPAPVYWIAKGIWAFLCVAVIYGAFDEGNIICIILGVAALAAGVMGHTIIALIVMIGAAYLLGM